MPQDMLARARLLSVLLASTAVFASALQGCAADAQQDDNDAVVDGNGDGTTGEDEIVSERQLMGNELPQKTISLTFDDGPGQRTVELADYLAAQGIKATFFINGMKVPGRQNAIDAIINRGHLLANHTQNHKQLTRLSNTQVVSEVSQTDAIIAAAQPNGPWLIRAPFGAWNGTVARTINGTTMKKYVGSVFWDVGGALTNTAAADWDCWGKGVSVQRCGELYLNEIQTKKRGIVLMHDIHNKTIDMVKAIVPKLKQDGYRFVQLTEVPAVQRAIGAPVTNADDCASSTLGRNVAENVCVQSRRDEKWYRCVDGEWAASAGAADAACTQRFPL
jgi:peptidoglycan/xylan/chitin deacetylase (PgdA/CDA1 family)